MNYPSIMNASNVVSPFSSGLPPKPTVPSHCSRSHTEQPSTIASIDVLDEICRISHAKLINGNYLNVLNINEKNNYK